MVKQSPYMSFIVFLPNDYLLRIGWKANTIDVEGETFGQTSRLITAFSFDEGAIKFVRSVRDPLHGWRDKKYDKFALQHLAKTSRNVRVFMMDDVIDKYVQEEESKPGKLTPEFFARRYASHPPVDLLEKLPKTAMERPLPAFYSPKWVALHEEVPRYFYHVPEGKVAFGKTIRAYKIQEPEFADDFGRGYRENRYVWLSIKPIYYANAYIIDITKLNNDDIRFTGQVEGNILHKGDIPPSAVVAIRKSDGEIVYR